MKTIGLLGGMSWESTALYYKIINEETKEKLGGFHNAKSLILSVDFHEIEELQRKNDWKAMGEILTQASINLEKGGAECLVICTNTMHKVAPFIEENVTIPIIHIADATAELLEKDSIKKVGLLGTGFTMREEFYKGRLTSKFSIDVVTPNEKDMDIIHSVIYNELCLGVVKESSQKEFIRIIKDLKEKGAEGVILGCTEICMIVNDAISPLKVYDTTSIHGKKAVEFSLS